MAFEIKGISNVRALNKSKNVKNSNKVVKPKISSSAKAKSIAKKNKSLKIIKKALEVKGINNVRALVKSENVKDSNKVVKPKTTTSVKTKSIARKKVKRLNTSIIQEASTTVKTKPVKSVKTPKSPKKMKKSKPALETVKDKTTMNKDEVLLALGTLFDIIEKSDESKELEADKNKIQLQLSNIQIPKCPERTIRIHIPHSIKPETVSLCLIASDIKVQGQFDDKHTVNYYTNLLSSQGVSNMPAVIPLHVLKTKYKNFTIKRQLMNQYDTFLVDVKISGYVYHTIGKTLEKRNKCISPLKLEVPNIKSEITKALRRTKIILHSKGDSSCIEVGHAKMKKEDVAQNVLVVVKWLVENYPGGWNNIRYLGLKTAKSISVPLYWSTTDSDEVKKPFVRHNKRKLVKTINQEYLSRKGAKIKVKGDKILVKNANAGWKEIPKNITEQVEAESEVEEESDSEMKIYL